jgi:hypothetical protein
LLALLVAPPPVGPPLVGPPLVVPPLAAGRGCAIAGSLRAARQIQKYPYSCLS